MTIPAGYSKVRMTDFDVIVNVQNDVVGMVDADGGELWFARLAAVGVGTLSFGSITNPVGRDAFGRINSYTQDGVSYTVTYGSFGISTITGGGVTLTQNYSTAGVPSGVTLS